MLNDSLANLGNSFVINRQMRQREEESAKDRDLRERMLNEQIAGRKDVAATQAAARDAKAKGGTVTTGLQITKPDGDTGYMEWRGAQEGLDALVQNFEGRGGKVQMVDPSNAQKPVLGHVIIKTPVGEQVLYPRTPEEFQSAVDLQKKIGVAKPEPTLTPVKTPGFTGALTPGGAYVRPDAANMTDVDKAELANLNRSLAAIDAEARKLAESPNADRGRALNTQREQLTAAKQKLVDKFKGGGAAPKATESPADDELVSVTNPQGKPVRIRKSQLEQALASGYTER